MLIIKKNRIFNLYAKNPKKNEEKENKNFPIHAHNVKTEKDIIRFFLLLFYFFFGSWFWPIQLGCLVVDFFYYFFVSLYMIFCGSGCKFAIFSTSILTHQNLNSIFFHSMFWLAFVLLCTHILFSILFLFLSACVIFFSFEKLFNFFSLQFLFLNEKERNFLTIRHPFRVFTSWTLSIEFDHFQFNQIDSNDDFSLIFCFCSRKTKAKKNNQKKIIPANHH